MPIYLLAFAVLLVAGLLAWAAAALLHLPTAVVVSIALAGVAAAAAIVILHFRAKKRDEGEAAGNSELDLLLTDANRKLRTSQQQGPKSLDSLPLLYLFGSAGSAKTTLVARSGLDPELLAGNAPRDSDVTPTPLVNVWYTRQGVIVEAGDGVRQSAGALVRLVTRTRPKAYRAAFGPGAPSRAAIVCVSAEQFLVPDAATSSLASARIIGAQLREVSRLLGAALPIYAIVTKLDLVPHFAEYVRNLSNDEARQVFGVTVPKSEASAGVYADKAARELSGALDSLYSSLGDFRVETLSRETELRSASGAYEFPREFGKLRKNLTQYLVELCKPSQLSANPYLRGFYFTGVRAQIVEDVVSEQSQPAQNPRRGDGATDIVRIEDLQALQRVAAQPIKRSVRVPQWMFLPRLFPETILGDKSALTATSQTAPARLFRRALFATLAGLFALYSVCLLISYVNNASVESRIADAARALPPGGTSVGDRELKALNDLRQVILRLDGFERDGKPWSYRFGLYEGDELDKKARRIYFDRFRPMFLAPTQASLIDFLGKRPPRPSPDEANNTLVYDATYNPLKAYLITTLRPDKSEPAFLTPVFLDYWPGTNQFNEDQKKLARTQVDFYGAELLRRNPYDMSPDLGAITNARDYLGQFNVTQRIYQDLLNSADKGNPEIDFNRKYDPSVQSINEPHRVRGAFSAAGFEFVQKALKNPGNYLSGDEWVLGKQSDAQPIDSGNISGQLKATYNSAFIRTWLDFLNDARFIGCGGLSPTSSLLNRLVVPASPLLELVYTVSHNTAVSDPDVAGVFQPAQKFVLPSAAEKLNGVGNNQAYMDALSQLSLPVITLAKNPPASGDPIPFQQLPPAILAAQGAVLKTTGDFNPIATYQTEALMKKLMDAPVNCVQKLIPPADAGIKEAAGKICKSIAPLMNEYPFNPKSSRQATIDELSNALAPERGAVWAVYNASFASVLTRNGNQFSANPAATQPVNPAFVSFLTQLAKISNGLYPPGALSPSLRFTVKFLPSAGISSATLIVDGQRIPSGSTAPKEFVWNGSNAGTASFAYNSIEASPTQGTWSLFHVVDDHANSWLAGGILEVPISTTIGSNRGPSGNQMRFEVSGPGAEMLRPGALTLHGCPSPVTK